VIAVQLPVARAQRSHAQLAVGDGSPVQVAAAVSVAPTCAVPAMAGPDVICGAESARAPAGASAVRKAAAATAAQVRRTAGRGPGIAARLSASGWGTGNKGTWPSGQAPGKFCQLRLTALTAGLRRA
jgi:hypothetical protein